MNRGFLSDHPERFDEILQRMTEGETLTAICKEIGCAKSTVSEWANAEPIRAERYARARMEQVSAMAYDVIDIADRDDLDPHDKRVRVDARKWLASKVHPAKFGDKLSGDPENPIKHVFAWEQPSDPSESVTD